MVAAAPGRHRRQRRPLIPRLVAREGAHGHRVRVLVERRVPPARRKVEDLAGPEDAVVARPPMRGQRRQHVADPRRRGRVRLVARGRRRDGAYNSQRLRPWSTSPEIPGRACGSGDTGVAPDDAAQHERDVKTRPRGSTARTRRRRISETRTRRRAPPAARPSAARRGSTTRSRARPTASPRGILPGTPRRRPRRSCSSS